MPFGFKAPPAFLTFRPFESLQIGMIFTKPSLRTRASFEAGVQRLGGAYLGLDPAVPPGPLSRGMWGRHVLLCPGGHPTRGQAVAGHNIINETTFELQPQMWLNSIERVVLLCFFSLPAFDSLHLHSFPRIASVSSHASHAVVYIASPTVALGFFWNCKMTAKFPPNMSVAPQLPEWEAGSSERRCACDEPLMATLKRYIPFWPFLSDDVFFLLSFLSFFLT